MIWHGEDSAQKENFLWMKSASVFTDFKIVLDLHLVTPLWPWELCQGHHVLYYFKVNIPGYPTRGHSYFYSQYIKCYSRKGYPYPNCVWLGFENYYFDTPRIWHQKDKCKRVIFLLTSFFINVMSWGMWKYQRVRVLGGMHGRPL